MKPKQLAITIITVIVGFWFWVVVHGWVNGETLFVLPSAWLWPFIMLAIASGVWSLALMLLFEEPWQHRWAIAWLIGISYLIIFGFSYITFIALLVMVLINLHAVRVARIEIEERTKLNPSLALRRGITAIIIPLLIGISFAYYQGSQIEKHVTIDRENPETFRSVISKTADTFLETKSINEARKEAGLTKEATVDRVFEYARDAFYDLTEAYHKYVPPIFAFGLFLIMWGISFVFVYTGLGVALLLYWLLRSAGFITVETVQVEAQRLKL